MKIEFLDFIDASISALGITNRSQFIRDSIREFLERKGKICERGLASAPPRYEIPEAKQTMMVADAPNASAEKIRPAVVVYGKGKVLRKRPGGAGPTNPPGDQPK